MAKRHCPSPPAAERRELPAELLAAIVGRTPVEADVSLRGVSTAWRAAVDDVTKLRGEEARKNPPGSRERRTVVQAWVAAGQLDLLQWGETQLLSRVSDYEGSSAVVRWLTKDTKSGSVVNMAARGGHLEVLEWLMAKGCPWDWRTCSAAAEGGHLELLQWLLANGCPGQDKAYRAAAIGGHLEVLQWLTRTNGCHQFDEAEICSGAARGGHLEVLEWLGAIGCSLDWKTSKAAARNGQLEVLKWLRANDCPVDDEIYFDAAYEGHVEVLSWLRDNGCPWHEGIKRGCQLFANLNDCSGIRSKVLSWLDAHP